MGSVKKESIVRLRFLVLDTLVNDGTSHCGRSTGERKGLDLYCVSEWCLSNRAEDRDGEAQIYDPTKELGPGQKQQK